MEIFEPDPNDDEALRSLLGEHMDLEGPGSLSPELYLRIFGTPPPPTRSRTPRTDIELKAPPAPPPSMGSGPTNDKLKALLAKMPVTPSSSQLLDTLRNAKPVTPQMRAATPEERVVGRLEEEGDPSAAMVQQQFSMRPKAPVQPTAMRATTGGERISDLLRDVTSRVKGAVSPGAELAANTTTPEPFHTRIDPTMGSAAPEKATASVLGKILKTPKKPPFAFAPVDEAAKARLEMLKSDAPIRYSSLPKAARPSALSKLLTMPPANPDDFVGVTISPATGQRVIGGQPGPTMAGKFPNQSKRTISVPRAEFTPKHIQQFYDTNREVLGKDPEAFLGGWYDKETDSIFLDVSKGFLNKEGTGDIRKATKFAEEQNPGTVMGKMKGKATGIVRDPATGRWPQAQKALFDPETYTEPKVGNLNEFLTGLTKDAGGRSFRDRIREMADIGKRAMKGEDPEWWDIRKTQRNPNAPIPRVYGEEGVAPMAGYTATMSPQNGPVDDMQMASEYMRRHIKGEPVVQPEWRVPETAMGKQPKSEGGGGFTPRAGAKFPNEKFYSVNAQKVREGRYDELTQDKVNDMYQALMGGDVAVLDRHWAKLAEDPASGIYTATEKNVIEPSMTSGKIEAYPSMYNAERDAAIEAGVPIKKHSAWVWEGIRDTIRRTGELFGQKHAAGAVPETTTGFNEIFENLLQKKAAHLGITVEKMEQLLRSGDESLLAAILSTPVGVEAYRRWKAAQEPPEGQAPVASPPSRSGGAT